MQPFSDPDALRRREDVEFVEESAVVTHEHHFELYEPIAGMAVVGVTNDAGEVLLLVHDDEPHALLPHGPVERGEEWTAAARRAVAEATGVAVAVEGVERVKRKHYSPADDDDRRTVADQVFLRASPAGDEAVADDSADSDDVWTPGWFDEIPVPVGEHNAEVAEDVRLFVD